MASKQQRNRRTKEPLYRKVNTRARHVRHQHGGDYRWVRNSKDEQDNPSSRGPMHSKYRRGLDYTPLYRFLISRVGEDWDAVHSEAVSRLDQEEPIFRLVALKEEDRAGCVCVSGSTFFSGLFVDEDNKLALVDPGLRIEDLKPWCGCCTHTFNGKPFVRKWDGP